MNIATRLRFVFLIILLVVVAGSAGYFTIFGTEARLLDCVYMTVISLTSVGYGEILPVSGNPTAEIFTMVLITLGLGIIMYGISTLTALIVEGEVSGVIRRKNMEQRIAKLLNHYIVCGGGQTGRHVLEELLRNKEKAVLIESDEEMIRQCQEMGEFLYVKGDATEDENMILAGIKRARGMVIALPSDKDTVYATMTARMLNPGIRIVSRLTDSRLDTKLRRAGANSVVSPNHIGGLRLASELIRPTVVGFLDKMLRSSDKTLRIHELTISEGSKMEGKTILSSHLKQKFELLVLGAQEKGAKDIRFNPSPDMPLAPGTILVVMGDVEKIAKARGLCEPE